MRDELALPTGKAIDDVRKFWESHPVAAAAIPYPLGSVEYLRYYDQLREANESPEFSQRLHEYENFKNRLVLDVGCGNGYVLSKYAQEGAEVYGVDITHTALALCTQRFALLGSHGHFTLGNAEELPFAEGTFDCVCSMGVLHHTPSPARSVEEIFRVLKPGGRLIVMLYHRNSALYRLTLPFLSVLTGKAIRQLVNEVDGIGNPRGEVFSKTELRRLLHDFKDLDMFAGLLKRWMLRPKIGSFLPERFLRRAEKHWGWFLYAKGVKP